VGEAGLELPEDVLELELVLVALADVLDTATDKDVEGPAITLARLGTPDVEVEAEEDS